MTFPIPPNDELGDEYIHPRTNQRYVRGPNGVWQKISIAADVDEYFVTQDEFETDQKRQDDIVEVGFDTQSHILMDTIQIKDEQVVQNDQINALETQIQLLAQTQAVGKWTYNRNISGGSVRPPASASFYATHQDGASTVLLNWADARLFMISKTDIDGKQFVFTEFEEGDKMEILATDGSSACYGTVTNQPTQEAYGNLVLAVERSNGGPSEGKEYLLSVYRPGSNGGTVDLDILDGRYVKKGGDLMTSSLEVMDDSGRPAFIATRKSDGEPRLAIYTDGKLETQDRINVDMPGSDDTCIRVRKNGSNKIELTNKGYINLPGGGILFQHDDGSKKSYLYNAGQGITQWTAYNGTQLKITARDGDPGGGRTYIDIKTANSAGTQGEDTGYRMKLFHVATPTDAYHGVNKKYVDEQIAQIDPADNIIVPGFTRPPGLRFNYTDGSSVSAGQFAWYDNGGRRLRVSSKSYDVDWGTSSPTGDINYSEAHLFHIWSTYTDSSTGENKWRIKVTGSFNRMDWHTNDILLYVPYNLTNGAFSPTAAYYITISGLF